MKVPRLEPVAPRVWLLRGGLARTMNVYLIEDDGPNHMKTFTAQVRVADRLHGHGVGRSKKEAEQQAAEAAYATLFSELPAVPAGEPVEADSSPGA